MLCIASTLVTHFVLRVELLKICTLLVSSYMLRHIEGMVLPEFILLLSPLVDGHKLGLSPLSGPNTVLNLSATLRAFFKRFHVGLLL